MCDITDTRIWSIGIAIVMALVLVPENPKEGYAVLLETNDFPPGYTDLPVDFVDIKRVQTMLLSHGWTKSHIFIRRDNITPETVKKGVEFLKKADDNDIVLFYICSHGEYIGHNLQWKNTFEPVFDSITADCRIVIIDSCNAASFLPECDCHYIGIGSVSAKETAWVGIPQEDLPITGFVFTYYFCDSMKNKVSIEEGVKKTAPLVKEYMSTVVYPVFKDVYPPETHYNLYNPHPVIKDQYPGDVYLTIERKSSFSLVLVFMGMLLVLRKHA
jgi:hypothetical protein